MLGSIVSFIYDWIVVKRRRAIFVSSSEVALFMRELERRGVDQAKEVRVLPHAPLVPIKGTKP